VEENVMALQLEEESMVKIHLDTDLGGDMDDLCALAMLLKWPGVEITGVTTVADVDGRRAGYTRYVLDLAGRPDIPVAAGADESCGRFRSAVELPREEAYWPEPIAPAPTPLADALALLKRSIEAGARVVAIGPFTNLALLDEAHPGLLAQADLYLMGGHLHPIPAGFPRWGNDVDWNVQYDVTSARFVFERYSPTLIPLEVTVQTALCRAYLPALRAAGLLGQLLARQAEATAAEYKNEETYGRTCAGLPDDLINFQHDPLACAVALGWDGVTRENTHIRTELRDGLLYERVDESGRAMTVVTAVDSARFNEFWLRLVTA
jgi:purine nucleosidase